MIAVILATAAYSVAAQSPEPSTPGLETLTNAWTMASYTMDTKKIGEGLNSQSEKGFFPVAMEVNAGYGFIVMFLKSGSDQPIPTNLVQTSMEKLPAVLNTLMKDKWLTMDIAVKGKDVFVLSIKDETMISSIEGTMSQVSVDVDAMKNDITAYSALGYVPFSLSYDGTSMWIAYMKDKRNPVKNVQLAVYPNDGLAMFQGIDYELKRANRPWAFSIVKDKIIVLYIQ